MTSIETVQVTHDLQDADDTALAAEMNEFLTSLGLELNSERETQSRLNVEYSAYDVSTPFEELAELVKSEFPGYDTEITDEYDEGETTGSPHFAHTLSITPSAFV